MNHIALGIIDYQRGFIPAEEGERLHQQGFGELPVTGGAEILPRLNRLAGAFAVAKTTIFTTQDWHPHITAHFSEEPDYVNSWPVHCVDGSLGAELHPELTLSATRERFIKGFEPLENGEDDTSYSAHYAEDPVLGVKLPEWLQKRRIDTLYLAGLALDYCVGKSALDFKLLDGFDVTVVTDASAGISEESSQTMLQEFADSGIKTITTDQLLQRLEQSEAA